MKPQRLRKLITDLKEVFDLHGVLPTRVVFEDRAPAEYWRLDLEPLSGINKEHTLTYNVLPLTWEEKLWDMKLDMIDDLYELYNDHKGCSKESCRIAASLNMLNNDLCIEDSYTSVEECSIEQLASLTQSLVSYQESLYMEDELKKHKSRKPKKGGNA